MSNPIPDSFRDEEELDEFMTRPSVSLVNAVRAFPKRLLVLGAGGKMGPSLAVRAARAAGVAKHDMTVTAVSRFSDSASRAWLNARGVETVPCDLMDRRQTESLPDADAIVYLVGRKFGTSEHPDLTWAINTIPVVNAVDRYAGIPFVALSTGCVYPFVDAAGAGSNESDELTPIGEYANACVARERLFEYLSRKTGTPVVQVRLNYALDLRYGVLVDIARAIVEEGRVDVSMGWFNAIWQGDANDAILRLIPHADIPPLPINLTGEGKQSVRQMAMTLSGHLGKSVAIVGDEGHRALLSNTERSVELLGSPSVPLDVVAKWTAAWMLAGGRTLGKPTRFQETSGVY